MYKCCDREMCRVPWWLMGGVNSSLPGCGRGAGFGDVNTRAGFRKENTGFRVWRIGGHLPDRGWVGAQKQWNKEWPCMI